MLNYQRVYPSRQAISSKVGGRASDLLRLPEETCARCPVEFRNAWGNEPQINLGMLLKWETDTNGLEIRFPIFFGHRMWGDTISKTMGQRHSKTPSRPAICDQLIGLKIAALQDELGFIRQARPEISELHMVPSGSDLVRNSKNRGCCWDVGCPP